MVNELEMPDLPWFNVEEEIQRLREVGMLAWTCHLRPTYPHEKSIGDIPFAMPVRNKFLRGVPIAVIALFYKSYSGNFGHWVRKPKYNESIWILGWQ